MAMTPDEILASAYESAKRNSISELLAGLPSEHVQDLKIIADNAETQKAVLGVTLTSLVYKVLHPAQDIRRHQDGMDGGYSGRTFDTKHITPFLKEYFPHYAMAESAWLTRSLEQPHPFDFQFPGNIRNSKLKTAFLNTLDRVQNDAEVAPIFLNALMAFMLAASTKTEALFAGVQITGEIAIARIADAVSQHIHYPYGRGVRGTARIPVLAIYAVYRLLMPDIRRYADKTLAPLEPHTSADARSRSLGDIDILNVDHSCFESVEIKHNKPITTDMVGVVYRKIKNTSASRYYILTTSEPNVSDYAEVMQAIERYKRIHPCQIIVNGVIPSLKYYMRLLSEPQAFIAEYTTWLEFEYRRASGIKSEHLQAWLDIRRRMLNAE